MHKKVLIPLATLCLAALACSFFAPTALTPTPQPTATRLAAATPVPTDAIAPTSQPTATIAAAPTATPGANPPAIPATGTQAQELKGTFTYTNDVLTTFFVEDSVALIDLYGFVTRNQDWKVPVSSQTLGYMAVDAKTKTGTFDLNLPLRPTGTVVDVNPTDKSEKGLQVFVLSFLPNITGSPYATGDDAITGWPSYLASTVNDSQNQDEIIGGKVVIWSPDENEHFPSGFGADGKLFTADDPVMRVPAGWSVIDLDQKPFAILRDAQPKITLNEPKDVAVKDFSKMSFSDAFKNVVDFLKVNYAFNGIQSKQPDWDALYQKFAPDMQKADQDQSASEFAMAMHAFTQAFKDGHTGVYGDEISRLFTEQVVCGYGFALQELDNKQVIVVYVKSGTPAANSGMAVGDEVTSWNGKPIGQAISEVQPFVGPFSSDFDLRANQVRFLVRAPMNTPASVTFNHKGSSRTIQLTAINEQDSYYFTSPYKDLDQNALPVTYQILPNNIGYIKVNSNDDDLNLLERIFERALQKFTENNVTALIIDMRSNLGGHEMGLAGFFTNKDIPMGQTEYYNARTGKFESQGEPDKFTPNQNQYHFDKMVTLVGLGCASACELEAYGFSQIPGMVVIGQYPTSGTEAEVSRGQIDLPAGLHMQAPTGRIVNADGSLFLEGTGVQPTMHVPVTADTVLGKSNDPVLDTAIQQLTK